MLYTGANYPLLYGRRGRGEKEWGKGGEGRKDWWEVVDFLRTVRGKSKTMMPLWP